MDRVRSFYDGLAGEYDRLFADWGEATRRQAEVLDRIFAAHGFGRDSAVLDCACGIGTQALGLAALGYRVTGSDISPGRSPKRARGRATPGCRSSCARRISADCRSLWAAAMT